MTSPLSQLAGHHHSITLENSGANVVAAKSGARAESDERGNVVRSRCGTSTALMSLMVDGPPVPHSVSDGFIPENHVGHE